MGHIDNHSFAWMGGKIDRLTNTREKNRKKKNQQMT